MVPDNLYLPTLLINFIQVSTAWMFRLYTQVSDFYLVKLIAYLKDTWILFFDGSNKSLKLFMFLFTYKIEIL